MIWIEIYCDVEDVADPQYIGVRVLNKWAVVQWQLDDNLEPIIDSAERIIGRLSIVDAMAIANGLRNKLNLDGERVTVSNLNPKSRFQIRSIEYELMAYDRGRLVFSGLSELERPLTLYDA